ncbi:MAG: hypothetical protein OD918_00940 [Gammaproteobacteria bacterium]
MPDAALPEPPNHEEDSKFTKTIEMLASDRKSGMISRNTKFTHFTNYLAISP